MTCYHQRMFCCCCRRNHRLIIAFVLILSVSILTHFSSLAQGRVERTQVRSLIGSRPPRCEKRCRNCSHCEAVQVPVDPGESKHHKTRRYYYHSLESLPKAEAFSRDDDKDDYKPLCWKCKCGSYIFNP